MSDEQKSAPEPTKVEEGIPLAQFLESVSPGQIRQIINRPVSQERDPRRRASFEFRLPEIQLHCPSDVCNGERFFRAEEDNEDLVITGNDWNFEYVMYKCANCQKQTKTFALAVKVEDDAQRQPTAVHSYKFGRIASLWPADIFPD
jgi:hypothetical protein